MSRTTPDWKLERYLLGELSSEERARIAADPTLAARIAELREQDAQILAAHPPEAVAKEVRRRAGATASRQVPRRIAWIAAPALASGLALAVVALLPRSEPRGFEQELVRSKGLAPAVLIDRRRGSAPELERLADGGRVQAGDLLQLHYRAAGRRYGMIFSIDGRGAITLHHPAAPEAAPELADAPLVSLPHAFELDDAPGFERFFLITSAEPFRVEPVLERARALSPEARERGALELPPGLEVRSLSLIKEPR
jgi:hypothetical protein